VVCHNDVWPLRQGCFFHNTDPIETKDTHQPAPENEQFETKLLPFGIHNENQEKWIEKQGNNSKHHCDIQLPN
jgi:hypothetical protein